MLSVRIAILWLLNLCLLLCSSGLRAEYGAWKAKVIDVSVDKKNSFLEGYVWKFSEISAETLSGWSGVTGVRVNGNQLEFVTNGTAKLELDYRKLNQVSNNQQSVLNEWSRQSWPWVVQVKLMQSKDRSEWTVEAEQSVHGRKRITKKKVVLIGKHPQIIQFDMGSMRKRPPYLLRLNTNTGGNNVSIEWVRIVRPSINKIFRYSFKFSERPLASKLAFAANGRITVYVNGEKIGQHGARHPFSRRLNIYENIEHFKQGENTLCVSIEGYSAYSKLGNPGYQFFFMEGGVIGEKGGYEIIQTDNDWRGVYAQDNCAISDSSGERATVKGSVRNTWPLLRGVKAYERLGDAPDMGRIQLRYKDEQPIYSEGESVVVTVDVPRAKEIAGNTINYILTEWSDDKRDKMPVLVSGKVISPKRIIDLGKVLPGTYELVISVLMKGKVIEERRQELVVVGRINQASVDDISLKSGLELRQVDAIEFKRGIKRRVLCANKDGSGVRWFGVSGSDDSSFSLSSKARLLDDYIELPWQRSAWCSVEYEVGVLDKPHLIEIEYPRNQKRNMIFNVSENSTYRNLNNIGDRGGVPRLSSGVYTENESGNGVVQYIYWPNSHRATLNIVNAGQGRNDRGAINKLTVYEITNGLPRYKFPLETNKSIRIGPFVERVDRTTPGLFYQGSLGAKFSSDLSSGYFPGYYNAWYRTISNLIQYLRFSGQNTYYAGVYMYYGGWFPSESFQGHVETGSNEFAAGWRNGAIDLLAKMFELNGLELVLGVEFIGSRKLVELDALGNIADNMGAQSIRFINKNGYQSRGFQDQGYNFLHTEVKQEILKLADEIGERFSKYKAVKGVTWMRSPEFPWDADTIYRKSSQLNIGYGDTTIALYKNETSSNIPAWYESPLRFKKRYKWLLGNEKEKWISWRCQKVFNTDKQILAHLKKYRKDWQLWRLVPRPAPKLVDDWSQGTLNFRDIYRYGGIDPLLYSGNSGTHLMALIDVGSERKYEKRRELFDIRDEIRSLYESKQFVELFNNTAAFVHTGFMLESQLANKQNWDWNRLTIVGYSVPDKGGLYPFLIESGESLNAGAIAIGWSDIGHFTGSEVDIRKFIGARKHGVENTSPATE